MWMTITAPHVNGSAELCFLFSPWNLWRSRSRVWGVTEAHNKGGGISGEEKAEFGIKKRVGGVKNQNGNDICHQRRPALCQPLMRLFPKWTCKGGNLHCKFAAHWPFSQVDGRAGAWFPHRPNPSFGPTIKAQPPHSLLTPACPKGLSRSHGGGGRTLSQADSPEPAHTVGALFQQHGLGRVRVKGRRLSFDRL